MGRTIDLQGKRLILFIAFCTLLVVIGLLIGVGIRSAVGCKKSDDGKSTTPMKRKKRMAEQTKEAFEKHTKIINEMKAENVKRNLE